MRKIILVALAIGCLGSQAQAQYYPGIPFGAYVAPYPPVEQPQFGIYAPHPTYQQPYPVYTPTPFTVPALPQVPDPSQNARSRCPWGVRC